MAQNYTTMSKSAIQYLCGLIRDLASVSEGIDDLNLRSDGVMSSVKVDKLIKQCLQDANDYSDEVVNALTHLVAEKIDFEPTLDNTTDKLNTLLLYSKNNDNNYTQYLRLTTELLNLGDTSLDLSGYIKKIDAEDKFVLKTSYDDLVTEVDKKVNKTDIIDNLTSTDTNKPLSANQGKVLKDKINLKANDSDVVKKTDMSTTINSTSTNDTVPTTKAVYDNIKNKNTIQPTGTIAKYSTVFDWAMNNVGATCGYEGNMFDDCPLPNTWGTLVCIGTKVESGLKVLFCTNFNKDIYIRTIQRRNGVNAWVTSWQRVCTTSVEDTSLKKLKNSSDINSDADITYTVKNGRCDVSINTLSSTKMETGNITLTTGLPIPVNPSCWYSLSTNSNATTATLQNLLIRIDPSGNMIAYKGTNNVNYFGSFSYPVAES